MRMYVRCRCGLLETKLDVADAEAHSWRTVVEQLRAEADTLRAEVDRLASPPAREDAGVQFVYQVEFRCFFGA